MVLDLSKLLENIDIPAEVIECAHSEPFNTHFFSKLAWSVKDIGPRARFEREMPTHLRRSVVRALQKRSTQVRQFTHNGRITADFFKPASANSTQAFWPELEVLQLTIPPFLTAGEWVYKGLRGKEIQRLDREGKMSAFAICDDTMNNLYLAMAKALFHMPKLKQLSLKVPVYSGTPMHEFTYTVDRSSATAVWRSWPLFVPDDKVVSVLRKVALAGCLDIKVEAIQFGWRPEYVASDRSFFEEADTDTEEDEEDDRDVDLRGPD
jgi:hypothetical protein